jgi:hypothetical protein
VCCAHQCCTASAQLPLGHGRMCYCRTGHPIVICVHRATQAAERLFGADPSELDGRCLADYVTGADDARDAMLQQCAEGRRLQVM